MTHKNHRNRFDTVEAILFDAYGTLVEITDKRVPVRRLLQIGEQQSRPSTAADAVTLMTAPMGLHQAARRLGIRLTKEESARLEEDLRTELASIRPFPETLATLEALRARGYRLGLCSNLAADYADPVRSMLASHLDVYVWSFDVGSIKPDPRIYAHSCQTLACAPSEVLMIGDTLTADVRGPRASGMQAIHLGAPRARADRGHAHPLSDLLYARGAQRIAPLGFVDTGMTSHGPSTSHVYIVNLLRTSIHIFCGEQACLAARMQSVGGFDWRAHEIGNRSCHRIHTPTDSLVSWCRAVVSDRGRCCQYRQHVPSPTHRRRDCDIDVG